MNTAAVQNARAGEAGHRFVAFTFAAAEMVLEASPHGTITYAAGAFRSRLGTCPEALVGRQVSELIAPADWDVIDSGLVQLRDRGRLLPCIVRLANPGCSSAVLSGMKLVPDLQESPLCLTFGLPPAQQAARAVPPASLAQATQARLAQPDAGHIALVEMDGDRRSAERLNVALEEVSPETMASELAPGRFGLLTGDNVAELVAGVDVALRRQGGSPICSVREFSLSIEDLTPGQAAQAVRQALRIFSAKGTQGLDAANFGNGLTAHVEGALSQASMLRRAIAQREFTIAYQPIIHLASGKLHHYEALLRPSGSVAGYATQDLVCLIETVGLTQELDLAVAAMVCEAAQESTASLAFNLSGHSVQDPAFRDRLLPLLQASPAARAGRLLVELTETAVIESVEAAAETARGIREAGASFCLDDFGAGHTDIRLLRALPTDIVKIDGSFIPGLTGNQKDRAFVSGMIGIARAAGATVVAERIETRADADAAAAVGADFGQGWFYGRPGPLPPDALSPPRPIRAGKARGGKDEEWS